MIRLSSDDGFAGGKAPIRTPRNSWKSGRAPLQQQPVTPAPTFTTNRDGVIEINWDKYTPYLLEQNPNAPIAEELLRGSTEQLTQFLDENSVNIAAILLGFFILITGILILAK